jgi:hypothetical protein
MADAKADVVVTIQLPGLLIEDVDSREDKLTADVRETISRDIANFIRDKACEEYRQAFHLGGREVEVQLDRVRLEPTSWSVQVQVTREGWVEVEADSSQSAANLVKEMYSNVALPDLQESSAIDMKILEIEVS